MWKKGTGLFMHAILWILGKSILITAHKAIRNSLVITGLAPTRDAIAKPWSAATLPSTSCRYFCNIK